MPSSRILSDYETGYYLIPKSYHWSEIAPAFMEQNGHRLSQRLSGTSNALLTLNVYNTPGDGVSSTQLLARTKTSAQILDEIYFFGSLLRHIPEFVFGDGNNMNLHGFWLDSTKTITLNPLLYVEEYQKKYSINPISTLLHEMMHAFFDIFVRGSVEVAPKKGGIGRSGHGPAWADAMLSVQNSLKQEVPFSVDCGIFNSVKVTMFMEHWRCSTMQMIKWGASWEEICDWAPGGRWGNANEEPESLMRWGEAQNVQRCPQTDCEWPYKSFSDALPCFNAISYCSEELDLYFRRKFPFRRDDSWVVSIPVDTHHILQ